MEIKKGSYRLAILIGSIVIKIPRPYLFRDMIWGSFKKLFVKIGQNIDEYNGWLSLQESYLVKTYFTFFGLINIQKRANGNHISREEVEEI